VPKAAHGCCHNLAGKLQTNGIGLISSGELNREFTPGVRRKCRFGQRRALLIGRVKYGKDRGARRQVIFRKA
jgi:hypothetical protein